jgi:hypothetical protein
LNFAPMSGVMNQSADAAAGADTVKTESNAIKCHRLPARGLQSNKRVRGTVAGT